MLEDRSAVNGGTGALAEHG